MKLIKKLTPIDSELRHADNNSVKDLRHTNWLCLDPANKTLLADASRDTLIEGESFRNSPEYFAIHQSLLENQPMLQFAFAAFIKRVLCKQDEEKFSLLYPLLKEYFNQDLNGIFLTACNHNLGKDYLIKSEKLPNLRCNSKGQVFLETVHFTLCYTDTTQVEGNGTELKAVETPIPGTIISRFDLTIKGFKLRFVEYSNTFLQYLSLRAGNLFSMQVFQKAREEEHQQLTNVFSGIKEEKLSKLTARIQELITKSPVYPKLSSIVSLTKNLLLEPTNPTLLLAYERLINSPLPDFKGDEANEELCIKLHEAMECLLSELRARNNVVLQKESSSNNHYIEMSLYHSGDEIPVVSTFFTRPSYKPLQSGARLRHQPRFGR